MWRTWRVLVVVAAVLLALFAVTAASPGPYAGFALDDVRRPVYRGNFRYKRYFYNFRVNANSFNDNLWIRSNSSSRSRRATDGSISIKSSTNSSSTVNYRNIKKIPSEKMVNNDENWTLISLASSISDQNHTRSLVKNFLSNSLQHLQTHPASFINPVRSSNLIKSSESLDNLILSHTQHGVKPIQMYPEGSPPDWHANPMDPSVILIEDVHPSKLPKPPATLSSHHAVESWNLPNNKPLHSIHYNPLQVQKRPKPTVKPAYSWENTGTLIGNFGLKPQESYSTIGEIQPVQLHPRPISGSKPTFKPKPYVIKPLHHYTGPVTEISQSASHQHQQPHISKPSHSNNNHWNDPPVYKPPYNLVKPTRPVYHDPPSTSPETQVPSSEPVYKPVYTFPRPTKPPVSKPPHSSPRPPELHYHYPPPHSHDSPKYPSVVITQTSVLPVTEPTVRPPPPSIIVIDGDLSSPPPTNDCGTVQVINNFSKEPPQSACSDVMILINSPVENSASSSASAAAAGGGGAGGGSVLSTIGGIAAVSHSVALAAGTAAAGGAAGAAAAGAAAAGAAGAAAAGAAGAAAAGAAGLAGAAAAAGSAGAAAAAAAAAGAAGSGASAIPPAVTPAAAYPPASSPPQVTPILQPLDDEDYDYDDPTTSRPPKPTKPMKPGTMSYITSFIEYMNAFINTLPIIGPVSVSIWIILLGPLAFLLVGLMGVGTFLLPWVAPRIILDGLRRRSISENYPKFTQSAITFERKLKLGLLDNYY